GCEASARIIAYPIKWVKLTLPPRPRARWLLMTIRLSEISFAGTARTLVAVGTAREASMFSTIFAATPRIGLVLPPDVLPPDGLAGAAALAGGGALTGAAGLAGAAFGAGCTGAAGAFGAAGTAAAGAALAGAALSVTGAGAPPFVCVAPSGVGL